MYHTRKIGVFLSHIFGDYQQKLCQGIFDEALEFGYRVEVFASTDGETPGTLPGEESILQVAACQEFDGIIYANATYPDARLEEKIRRYLEHHVSCPVLYINQNSQLVNNVLLDNHSPFEELAEHFIKVHKSHRLCFLGCQNEPASNAERIRIFEHALEKNGVSCDEHCIFSTEYGMEHMHEAWNYFCEKEQPDAIMCYNDHMALDLMYVLQEKGIHIPQDIAISGCDSLSISEHITPTLTTITFPTYEVGQEAVRRLIRLIDGNSEQTPSIIKATTRIGCSCGCHYRESPNPYYAIHQMHEISKKERRIYEDMHMPAALNDITTPDEGMDMLAQYISYIPHCSELYLCLYENWDNAPKHIQLLTSIQTLEEDDSFEDDEFYDENTIFLMLGYRNGKRLQPCSFVRKDILPDFILKKTNSHYICAPLYFEEKAYGYLVLAFEENQLHYDFHVTSWIHTVCRMLKRIADHKHMTLLINRLEDIYIRDELTGLYNQRGFHSMSNILLADALETGTKLFAASFDINGLNQINQDFGHSEGNFAIQVVAGALKASADDSIIIARTGGDEFCVLAAGYEQTDVNAYMEHIQTYLDNYTRLHKKPYAVSVSHGCALSTVSNARELDTLIRNAEQTLTRKVRQD